MAVQHSYCHIKEKQIPVRVYRERRGNVRASVGKSYAILRLPLILLPKDEAKHWEWFQNWLETQLTAHPQLMDRLAGKDYQDGDHLHVGARRYTLRIGFADKATHSARLRNGQINLALAQGADKAQLQKAIKHLLSRVVADDFNVEITQRVMQLNDQHFRKPIKGVFLKYNQSNWGSCSANKNINLSTRLLFAPPEVVDYVIIHELAHLVEMNHSPKFWALVENAMPNYRDHEKWLKTHGNSCDF
jgi:predicted metal-dependent hydrolase